MKIGAYTVKNKFYYEDEPLNEAGAPAIVGRTLVDLLAGVGSATGKVIAKGVGAVGKPLLPVYGTYKAGNIAKKTEQIDRLIHGVKVPHIDPTTGKSIQNMAAGGKTVMDHVRGSRRYAAKELIADALLTRDRTWLGKAKLGTIPALAGSTLYDKSYNDGEQTKKIKASIKTTGKNIGTMLRASPETIGAIGRIGTGAAATLSYAGVGFLKSFNVLYAKNDCYSNPDSEPCVKLRHEKNAAIKKQNEADAAYAARRAEDEAAQAARTPLQRKVDSLKELPAKASEKLATYSTGQKTAAGIGAAVLGLTAAAVAAKAIKDSFKKKDWYNKKCSRIQNPDQKEKCQKYVYKRTMKELQSKLSRCKLSNNPQKCVDMITAKIQEINKKTD